MKYSNIVHGIFMSRPNRFIANVNIDGKVEVCHVKNTGRCKELLIEGVKVILEKINNPLRKTAYDLIAVYKGDKLINMDSQAPNKVVLEWLGKTNFFGKINLIHPETKFYNSRFDFYLETEKDKVFIEVKGVTLEENGVVLFPDAPTIRGEKHINELIKATKLGYKAFIIFVVQLKECKYFTPNIKTQPSFLEALKRAEKENVGICAVNCDVSEDTLDIDDFVKVEL